MCQREAVSYAGTASMLTPCLSCVYVCVHQVMAALGLQKAGPELGKTMAAIMDWQLVHPKGTLEECQQFVKGLAAAK